MFLLNRVLLAIALLAVTLPSLAAVKIDRIWQDDDIAQALVTYKNETNRTYGDGITIKCIALGPNGEKLALGQSMFYSHVYGEIKPGFEDSLEVSIIMNGAKMHSIQCDSLPK
jgi:hypothetical protein